ncbi:MAG: hypothetical protein HQM13_04340 [SAR324 cluster bacterium]|nr:hypothetical protein [SAR324 cluster bacterium]
MQKIHQKRIFIFMILMSELLKKTLLEMLLLCGAGLSELPNKATVELMSYQVEGARM